MFSGTLVIFDALVSAREEFDLTSAASSKVASSGNGGSVNGSSSKVVSGGKEGVGGDLELSGGGGFERPLAALSSKSSSPISSLRLPSGPSSRSF